MQTFFRNNNSDELILFFCGWGLDEKPFNPIKSDRDILFVFDYVNATKNFKFDFDFLKYKKITLIAFSYGVFVAGFLKDNLPKCDLKIAINGTLKPLDENLGIPEKIFSLTLEHMSENTAYKFREKLFDDKAHLDLFNQNLPFRDLKSSLDELSALKDYFLQSKEVDFKYDMVLIGEKDKVIPTKNQKNFWQTHKNLLSFEGGHFLFYKFENFDSIIGLEKNCELTV